jgi:geranylgeranyl diphosphate synthase type II
MQSPACCLLAILFAAVRSEAFVSHSFGTTHRIATAFSNSALSETVTAFDLDEYLLSKKGPIEKALEESVVSQGPETKKICESMLYSLMAGGKRIRPVLCLAACEMFAGSDEKAMPAAVSLEMIHTMSLIHDDLPSMDNDDLRRGKPTNHVRAFPCALLHVRRRYTRSCHVYANVATLCSYQVLYGEDVAILAGDALLSTAFQHVAENTEGVDPQRILDVVVRLGQSVGPKGLAGGQVMDLECEGKDDVTLDDLKWIHTHKTATLLQVAVASGAIIGGATPEEVKACEKFALNIGLAFQVADDILDVTASTEDLGKTAGKDEDTDKTTYPKLMGLDGAKKEARRLIDEAKDSLAPFGDRAAPLLAIADYIIDRKN